MARREGGVDEGSGGQLGEQDEIVPGVEPGAEMLKFLETAAEFGVIALAHRRWSESDDRIEKRVLLGQSPRVADQQNTIPAEIGGIAARKLTGPAAEDELGSNEFP